MVENVDAGRPRTFPALTGLRFFAAAAVLLFHYGAGFADRAKVPHFLAHILHNGYMGVSTFFILSGFIITYTYKEKIVTAKFCADFAIARLARLYPVYLIALLLALPVLSAPLSAMQALSVLSMVQAWTPPASHRGFTWVMQAWTLSVEAFFYIFFVATLPLLKRANALTCGLVALLAAMAIIALGSSSVSPGVELWQGLPQWAPVLPAVRCLEFGYGALLCRLMLAAPRGLSAVCGLPATLGSILAIVAILGVSDQANVKAVSTVLMGLLIVQLAEGRSAVSRALGNKGLLLLGGASYSLYLFQGPVRALCAKLIVHPVDQLASPILTLSMSIICFLWLEQPSRRAILMAYKHATGALPRSHRVTA